MGGADSVLPLFRGGRLVVNLADVVKRSYVYDENGWAKASRAISECAQTRSWVLDLSELGLVELPPEVMKLTFLRQIDLSKNNLSTLPAELASLELLQSIELHENRITSLPAEIFSLKNLRVFDIANNKLKEIPSDIGKLTSLLSLALSGNGLNKLPEELGNLRKLEDLYISHNELTGLPQQLENLQSLKLLFAWGNRFTTFPPVVETLACLRTLHLGMNEISYIPKSIGKLKNLEKLMLNNNTLKELPIEIAELTSIIELSLYGNLFPQSYLDSLEQGIDSFRVFLSSLEEQTRRLFEAKLLVTGEGKVGKSWALAALGGADPHDAVGEENTTWGIDRGELKIEHPEFDGEQIVLNTWDFGGQEIYRVTHQFFFSPDAIYLLVWNPRVGAGPCRVREWLRTIALRTGSAPTDAERAPRPRARVIMVATHAQDEGGSYNPDYGRARLEPDLQQMIVDEIAIDSERGHNIEALRAMIARHAAQLPEMGQPVNERWAEARKAVLALRKTSPWIDFDRFSKVCAKHGVREPVEIKSLAWTYLHSLGRAVWYGDVSEAGASLSDEVVLANTVVLDAVWLSRAFVQVLEDEFTRAAGGMLDHRRFSQIWTDHGRAGWLRYKPHEYEILKQVMRRFDVALPTRESEGHRSLVPQLVPADAPELPWDEAAQAPGSRTIRLSCQLDYEAIGLAPRLIAATEPWHVYENDIGLFWEGGVFLRDIASFRNEALIRIIGVERPRIDIVVSGEQPAFLMQELFKVLESEGVLGFWKGMTKTYSIGCPTRLGTGELCPGFFKFNVIVRRLRDEVKVPFNCDDCAQDWSAVELISGFEALNRHDTELSERYMLEHLFNHQQRPAPRLFLLESLEGKLLRPMSWNGVVGHRFKITLLSEFSGKPVACSEFTLAKSWVKWIGPVTRLASLALTGAAVPLGGDLASQFTESATLLDKLSGLPDEEGRPPFDADRHGSIRLGDEQLASFAKFLKAIDLDPREHGMGIARGPDGKWYWMSAGEVETYTPQAAA